jgi:hypothetical protein
MAEISYCEGLSFNLSCTACDEMNGQDYTLGVGGGTDRLPAVLHGHAVELTGVGCYQLYRP